MYGAMMAERNDPAKNLAVRPGQGTGSNVAKQRSFDVMAERDSSRGDREKDFRRAVTCNNSVDSECLKKAFKVDRALLLTGNILIFFINKQTIIKQ